jgi:hypothetical protein
MTSVRVYTILALVVLLVPCAPHDSAAVVKAVVGVVSYQCDGTTLVFHTTIQITGQPQLQHDFAGLLTNIADAPAAVAYLKGQVVNYALAQFSVTLVANEVIIFNAPQ